MSQELITAAQALIQRRHKYGWSPEVDAAIEELDKALFRQRSSVESVELPEPECWADGGDLEQLKKLGMGGVLCWPDNGNDPRRVPLYTASTVRSLIAAAVERERAACATAASEFLTKGRSPLGPAVAAAIRERGDSFPC